MLFLLYGFKLLHPSEDVTQTWIKHKGRLIKSRPRTSNFSFTVCLTVVFSIVFGFLSGFITAGVAINKNFTSVYERLIAEAEASRKHMESEREKLKNTYQQAHLKNENITHNNGLLVNDWSNSQVHEQAIFSVFSHAIDSLKKNDIKGACSELKNILTLSNYNGQWRKKAQYIVQKKCNYYQD